MANTPEVTVIIPNYNGKTLLENCIRTLEQQTCSDFKLLVIDNGSTDGSVNVASQLPDFEMVSLPTNTGFCGAVNEGIRRTKTPYFILLNNDTEAEPEFVEALLCAIKRNENIFSCSAMMIDYHNRRQLDNAGDLYTALGWAYARGKGKALSSHDRAGKVFSSCGGAAIYKKAAVEQIGLFDEHHFAYLEDVDIGYRARIYGYDNCYAPKAKVYHVGSATTGNRYNEKKVFLAARNSMFLVYKNMPFLQVILNMPFLLFGILVKWLFFLRKRMGGEYLRGIAAGIRECRKCKKVRFEWKHLCNYLRIQMELWWNIVLLPSNRG
jgi:GT2 family glycosyltransferase